MASSLLASSARSAYTYEGNRESEERSERLSSDRGRSRCASMIVVRARMCASGSNGGAHLCRRPARLIRVPADLAAMQLWRRHTVQRRREQGAMALGAAGGVSFPWMQSS
jgi:hypothetical protein